MYDVRTIRKDFPILTRRVHDHPLTYLDNAATTQKPRAVIDALVHFYEHSNANVHRGIHTLAEESTEAYEATRTHVARFLAAATGVRLRWIPLLPDGTLDAAAARSLIGPATRLLAITQMSNVLGTIVPVAELAALAHAQGALVLVDGAQSAGHLPVNVADLDCDFFAMSAHK